LVGIVVGLVLWGGISEAHRSERRVIKGPGRIEGFSLLHGAASELPQGTLFVGGHQELRQRFARELGRSGILAACKELRRADPETARLITRAIRAANTALFHLHVRPLIHGDRVEVWGRDTSRSTFKVLKEKGQRPLAYLAIGLEEHVDGTALGSLVLKTNDRKIEIYLPEGGSPEVKSSDLTPFPEPWTAFDPPDPEAAARIRNLLTFSELD
jgi:hypothetical protein